MAFMACGARSLEVALTPSQMESPNALLGCLLLVLLVLLGVLVWLIKRNENRFLQQAREIIANNDVTYDDVHDISESWHIERERLLHLLRTLLGESLEGKSEKLKLKSAVIRTLVEEHRARTPFSELPENISLQLTALSTTHASVNAQVSQLAGSLGELYSKHQREIKKQKTIAVLSLAIGFVSLIVAVVLPMLPNLQATGKEPPKASGSASPTR
jgi:hypothetical protein